MPPSRSSISLRVCREVHEIIRTAGGQHSLKARVAGAFLGMHVHPLTIVGLVLGSLRGMPTANRHMHNRLAQNDDEHLGRGPDRSTHAVFAAREFLLDVAELACQKIWVIAEQLETERESVSKELTRHFPSKNSRSARPRQVLRRDRDVQTSVLLKGSDSTLLRCSTHQGRYSTCVGFHLRGVTPPA